MKTALLIIIVLSLQGCLKVEVKSPDSLVADTVQASKDAYQAVSDSIKGNKHSTFTHRHTFTTQDNQDSATNICLSKVKDVATTSISTDKFDIRETQTKNGKLNDQPYIECKIVVVSQK